jgi:stringent starvation protein B
MNGLSQLTPRRPYLLRAFYEWLLDNQLTPHLVVDVTLPGVLCRWSMRATDKSC